MDSLLGVDTLAEAAGEAFLCPAATELALDLDLLAWVIGHLLTELVCMSVIGLGGGSSGGGCHRLPGGGATRGRCGCGSGDMGLNEGLNLDVVVPGYLDGASGTLTLPAVLTLGRPAATVGALNTGLLGHIE